MTWFAEGWELVGWDASGGDDRLDGAGIFVISTVRSPRVGSRMGDLEEGLDGGSPDRGRQLSRLRRIEGQVRGLQQMIGSDRGCVEISHQTDAVIAALRRVQSDLIRDHMQGLARAFVAGDLPEAERRRLADDLGRLVAKLV